MSSLAIESLGALKADWFSEIEENDTHCFSLKVDEILHQGKSKFQDVLVFKNKQFGNVLALDGRIQATEFDEFSYQEMITFLPLNSHSNPEKVLIIGGGDGGVARECAKHPLVKKIVQCEIDEDVPKMARLYLPKMAKGLDSKKLELIIGDGFEFLKNHQNEFDVIITDSSDPEGPAQNLFGSSFYQMMKDALKPKGIICCQGENLWHYADLISNIIKFAGNIFPTVSYAVAQTPTYPSGTIGFVICSLEEKKHFSEAIHKFDVETLEKMELDYYSTEMHQAAFILPRLFSKKLKDASENYMI